MIFEFENVCIVLEKVSIVLPELLLASTMPGLVTCAQSVWARCNLRVRRFAFDQFQEHLIFTNYNKFWVRFETVLIPGLICCCAV